MVEFTMCSLEDVNEVLQPLMAREHLNNIVISIRSKLHSGQNAAGQLVCPIKICSQPRIGVVARRHQPLSCYLVAQRIMMQDRVLEPSLGRRNMTIELCTPMTPPWYYLLYFTKSKWDPEPRHRLYIPDLWLRAK